MATIAEMLVNSGLQSSQQAPDFGQAISRGAEMAAHVEQVKLQRMKLEQDKKQLQDHRLKEFVTAIDKGKDFKDPTAKKNYYTKFLPRYRDQLNLTEVFPDDNLAFLVNNDENLARVRTLTQLVADGKMTGEVAVTTANNPLLLGDVPPTPDSMGGKEGSMPDLQGAIKFNREQRDKIKVAELTQTGQNQRLDKNIETAGQVAAREKIGKDYATFKTAGGLSGAVAKVKKLQEVVDAFERGEIKTRGAGTIIAGTIAGDTGLALANSKFKKALDAARSSINLKASLDSQFAAKEAEQQYSMRTLDKSLETEDNKQRAKDLLEEAKNDLTTKVREFQAHGHPVKMPYFGLNDYQKQQIKELAKEEQIKFLQGFAERYDVTLERLRKDLGL